MDSVYMAYEAIKSSRVPVTTFNISMTGSSATMLTVPLKKGWLCH